MTGTVVVALERFAEQAQTIAETLGADVLLYSAGVFERAFKDYRRIVALMSAGIVLRCIAPLIRDKWTDPCVVVVSQDLRYAIPILCGHHGANDLARELATLGITPVFTTATEVMGRPSVEGIARCHGCDVINRDSTRIVNAAMLDGDVPVYTINEPGIVISSPGVSFLVREGQYVVGIGCRRGASALEVQDAIRQALESLSIAEEEVFVYATTVKKMHEPGLIEAVRLLGGALVFVDDKTINRQPVISPSRAESIGLAGVAEPAALALAKHRELIMKKKVYGRVTIAISR